MDKLLDELDHPLPFVLFLGMALLGMGGIVTYLAKRANVPGLSNLVQHA